MEHKVVTRNDLLMDNLSACIRLSIEKEKYSIKGFPTREIDNDIEDRNIIVGKIINAMDGYELKEASYQVETILNKYEEERDLFNKYYNDSSYNFKTSELGEHTEINFLESNITINKLNEVLDSIDQVSVKKGSKKA